MGLRRAGYMTIDHRASPGLPGSKFLGEGSFFEADTLTCNHCQTPVVMNPDRVRARGHCSKCDKYLCDWCAAAYHQSKICRPFAQVVDELQAGKTPIPILARDMKGLNNG